MSQTWNLTIRVEEDLSSEEIIEEIEFNLGEVLGLAQTDGPKVANAE